MQTFLPYPDFLKSASCLDKKRAMKQVVETSQIIDCLLGFGSLRWRNHPAVRMWAGHEDALTEYYNIFFKHCFDYHKINFVKLKIKNLANINYTYPKWLGNPDFHASHRSNLLRKDFLFYSRFNWTEDSKMEYVWPVNKDGSFIDSIDLWLKRT